METWWIPFQALQDIWKDLLQMGSETLSMSRYNYLYLRPSPEPTILQPKKKTSLR